MGDPDQLKPVGQLVFLQCYGGSSLLETGWASSMRWPLQAGITDRTYGQDLSRDHKAADGELEHVSTPQPHCRMHTRGGRVPSAGGSSSAWQSSPSTVNILRGPPNVVPPVQWAYQRRYVDDMASYCLRIPPCGRVREGRSQAWRKSELPRTPPSTPPRSARPSCIACPSKRLSSRRLNSQSPSFSRSLRLPHSYPPPAPAQSPPRPPPPLSPQQQQCFFADREAVVFRATILTHLGDLLRLCSIRVRLPAPAGDHLSRAYADDDDNFVDL
ncbi:hypothetical protein CALVIDRAFT_602347, partial [Calocera viscosa TUFC12733]